MNEDMLLHWVLIGLAVYSVGVVTAVVGAFIWGRDRNPANKGMEWVE